MMIFSIGKLNTNPFAWPFLWAMAVPPLVKHVVVERIYINDIWSMDLEGLVEGSNRGSRNVDGGRGLGRGSGHVGIAGLIG
jgi:hypothetical protein